MPRKKSRLKPKTVVAKNEYLIYPRQCGLRSSILFFFFQKHKEPKRPPIVNIIRKTMLERKWNELDYQEMDKRYSLTKKRIHDTLSSKFEPIVIDSLCTYLDISPKITTKDILANYYFEQTDICKKAGARNESIRQEFLTEFQKAWSDEEYLKHRAEIIDSMELSYLADDIEEKIYNEEQKAIFYKLHRIYDEFPDLVKAFCDSFTEQGE